MKSSASALPFSIEFLTSPDVGNQYTMMTQPFMSRSSSPCSDISSSDDNRHTSSPISINGSLSTPNVSASSSLSDCSREAPSPTNTDDVAETIFALEQQAATIQTGGSKDKPGHSYIALISMAILSRPDKRMVLNDIYDYIMSNFAYYNNTSKAWRNSVRHNLSLNECFVKSGRAENGKGNYWTIHPACMEDFARGDFRRRNARRRARRGTRDLDMPEVPAANLKYDIGYVPMTCPPTYRPTYHPYSQGTYYQPAVCSQTSAASVLHPPVHSTGAARPFMYSASQITATNNVNIYGGLYGSTNFQFHPYQNW